MRLHARLLAAILCALSVPGCTKAVIDYAGKEEVRDNRVAEITRAWRHSDTGLVICVKGWPAERTRDASPVEFHMSVPLALFEDPERPPPLLTQDDGRRIRTIAIPEARTGAGCPARPEGAADIRTVMVGADYFASVSPREASDDQIEQFADPTAAEVTLFGLEAPSEPPDVALLYRHDAPVFEGVRLVWIDPGGKPVKPNKAAYAALPLAFATDVTIVVGTIVVFALAVVVAAY